MSGGQSLWAMVPVKSFARGKSRLGGVLGSSMRSALARSLFEHVFATLRATPGVERVLILTDDDEVEGLSRAHAAEVLRDVPDTSLSAIIDAGLAYAQAHGAGAALVCMSDLPHLSSAELSRLIAGLRTHSVVLAPDATELGTNVLALAPPRLFPSRFGRTDSFAQHLSSAERAQAPALVVRSPGLCFDVDGPEDLLKIERGSRGRAEG